MLYNIAIHIDESDKEFLETPESKSQIETVIYRKIQDLKQAHYDKQSRQTFNRGFVGVEKK